MIIEQYGIKLKRLTHADIEQVRRWRNHPEIRKNMAFKRYITRKMQEAWFESIDNKYNYYFIIEYEGQQVGVLNSKNVNVKDGYGEGGIFIWEQALHATFVPTLASFLMLDASFNRLQLFDKSYIRILPQNTKVIAYNRLLGYTEVPYQEKSRNRLYVLTREAFNRRKIQLEKTLVALSGGKSEFRISGKPSEKNLDEINLILARHGERER